MAKKENHGNGKGFPNSYSRPAPVPADKKRGQKGAVAGLGVEKKGYGR